jgi:hypothetical protein
MYQNISQIKKQLQNIYCNCLIVKWSHSGSNQGPSDYESDEHIILFLSDPFKTSFYNNSNEYFMKALYLFLSLSYTC